MHMSQVLLCHQTTTKMRGIRLCGGCARSVETHCGVKYSVKDEEWGIDYSFCSPECLMEWLWKAREAQPKLSKSKDVSGNLVDGP